MGGRKRKLKVSHSGEVPPPKRKLKKYPQPQCAKKSCEKQCGEFHKAMKKYKKQGFYADLMRSMSPEDFYKFLFHRTAVRGSYDHDVREKDRLVTFSSLLDIQSSTQLPRNLRVTLDVPGAPQLSRDLCFRGLAHEIQRGPQFVKRLLFDIIRNKLHGQFTPIYPRTREKKSIWREKFTDYLLSLDLLNIHWCTNETLKLSIRRSRDCKVLEDLYWKFVLKHWPQCSKYRDYNNKLRLWNHGKRTTPPSPLSEEEKWLPCTFTSFRHYFYTSYNVKWGLRKKSLCDWCEHYRQREEDAIEAEDDELVREIRDEFKYHKARGSCKKTRNFKNRKNAQTHFKEVRNSEHELSRFRVLAKMMEESHEGDTELSRALDSEEESLEDKY